MEQRRQQTTSNSIHIYKGKQGLKTAFNDILHSATEYCVYGGTGNFTALVPAYQQFFEQERIKKQIVQRNLFCTSETREDAAHQTTKYLNPDHNLPFSFVVYNDNALINIFDDTPNVTIKIESPTLANAFTNFFNDLWGRQ
ncbi:TPA: hypothetical protein HA278_01885 [Candidatus Woesearchaeota archaeon]|nr:hypothetical protein [Candidatus Woesearchaeota archaeon]